MQKNKEEIKEVSETKSQSKLTMLHSTKNFNMVRRITRTDLSLNLDISSLSKETRAGVVVDHEYDEEEFERKYEYSETEFLGLVSSCV